MRRSTARRSAWPDTLSVAEPATLRKATRLRACEAVGVDVRSEPDRALQLLGNVQEIRRTYAELEEEFDRRPSPAAVADAARKIGAASRALWTALGRQHLDSMTFQFLLLYRADLRATKSELLKVSRAAIRVASCFSVKNSRGRPKRVALRETVKRLTHVYDQFAVEPADRASLVEFVHAALTDIPHPQSGQKLLGLLETENL